MRPYFIEVIGTNNKKYRINVNHILYFYPYERKGDMITEIVFSNKESIESDETPSEIEGRINELFRTQ